MATQREVDHLPSGGPLASASSPPAGPWPAKFVVGGAVILLAVAYLVYVSLGSATVYYLTVSEVQAQVAPAGGTAAGAPGGRPVRVGGIVAPGSIGRTEGRLRFDLTDAFGRMPVVYAGILPDIFAEEADVVVEGRLGADGVFQAAMLLTKCPSRFEAAPAR